MPALITHHLFGEDLAGDLPAGLVEGEEELLAFLLGNQGPDPFLARLSTLPGRAGACRGLAREMHSGRVTRALLALRDGAGHLPAADERVGRAFVLGLVGHYALDRAAHPLVLSQVRGLAEADPSLAPRAGEVHALLESDIDVWILWEKRRATVLERPAADNLMRTARVERVGGALFSQVALSVFGISLDASEYAACVRDYERVYRAVDPAEGPRSRTLGALERLVRGGSLARALAHRAGATGECAAANLDRLPWRDPFTGVVRRESFADLFEAARLGYPALAEALSRGDGAALHALVGGLSYEGRPGTDD